MDEDLQSLAQDVGPKIIEEGAMQAAQEIMAEGVSPDELMPVMEMLELVLQNPEAYAEVRDELITQDFLDDEDLPIEFDPAEIGTLYLILSKAVEILESGQAPTPQMQQPQQFARGGLATIADDLADMGRNGDTMLAHVTPGEAMLLKSMGGSGTVNPRTGLPEFFLKKTFKALKGTVKTVGGLAKKITKALGPEVTGMLLAVAAPWAIPAISGALGMSALASGALYGGLTSAATGGNVAQGALLGGLGSGLGNTVGGAADSALGLGLRESGRQLLGSSLVGGVAGAATGKGFTGGAVQGALGQLAGSAIGSVGGKFSGALGAGIAQGGKQLGNAMTVGYDPRSSLLAGGLSGIATALNYQPSSPSTFNGLKSPSASVVEGLRAPVSTGAVNSDFGNYGTDLTGQPAFRDGLGADYSLGQGTSQFAQLPGGTQAPLNIDQPQLGALTPQTGGFGINNLLQYGTLAATAGSLLSKPPEIQQQIQQLPADKQEYFNRPSVSWDWDSILQDANQNNSSLAEYVSTNWPKVTSGQYNKPAAMVKMARGGALDQVARYMQGGGSGRSDNIDAKLSPGEYIIDAETVALLGDGSSEEGGRRLEAMRKNIRQHKGKDLAKGKFSKNAKSPLDYIKGAL